MTSWTLTHYDRPWLMNRDKSMHWAVRAKLIEEWKGAFRYLAMAERLPKGLQRVNVEVTHFYTSKRPPDYGAVMPAAKAAVDGLVLYGLVPDDSPKYLRLTFGEVTRSDRDALQLTITDLGAAE